MTKNFLLIFFFLSIALLTTTPRELLFFDAPEYIKTVSENGFFQAIGTGHVPIHPVFLAVLWVSTHTFNIFRISWEYAGNLSAWLFGCASILSFYVLSRHFFNDNLSRLVSTLIFAFFPAVWIINSNLMVESILLPEFILFCIFSFEFFENRKKFNLYLVAFSVSILIFSHIQTFFWLSTPLLLGLILQKINVKDKKVLSSYFLFIFLGIASSLIFYLALFASNGANPLIEIRNLFFSRVNELFDFRDRLNILRYLRNSYISYFRAFGSLTLFLVLPLLVNSKLNTVKIAWLLLVVIAIFEGSIWTGDFMIRRVVFVGVILAILIVKSLNKFSILVILYLIPMVILNGFLYSANYHPITLMNDMYRLLPKENILIHTYFYRPFVKNPNGKTIFIEDLNSDEIRNLIKQNKKVFIDSQISNSPYYVYSGDNLHIISLSISGKAYPKSLELLSNFCPKIYSISKEGDRFMVYELLNKQANESRKTGVIVYPQYADTLQKRIRRERIDYGDALLWGWTILTNRKEPTGWSINGCHTQE